MLGGLWPPTLLTRWVFPVVNRTLQVYNMLVTPDNRTLQVQKKKNWTCGILYLSQHASLIVSPVATPFF